MVQGGSQRIYGLIQKAPIFRKLAADPAVLALAHHMLGPRLMLYSMQAHIVVQGGDMDPHYDQFEMQPLLPFPVLAVVVLMLDDFTEANGATRIALGQQVRALEDVPPAVEQMVPLTGKRGAVAAYGGLLWHSTGVNRTSDPRHALLLHFCLPWIRQHENYQRTISTAMARDMTPGLRDLLGIHENLYGRRWRSDSAEYRPRYQKFDFGY
jgi:ectoine hydroxylase-related dioxygenase (phytanoyl-CoA dioxygenase family)